MLAKHPFHSIMICNISLNKIDATIVKKLTEIEQIPVQIWRKNENSFKKVFIKDKVVTAVRIDPYKETADIDESNNNWPVKEIPTRFQVFKANKQAKSLNSMQKAAQKNIKP